MTQGVLALGFYHCHSDPFSRESLGHKEHEAFVGAGNPLSSAVNARYSYFRCFAPRQRFPHSHPSSHYWISHPTPRSPGPPSDDSSMAPLLCAEDFPIVPSRGLRRGGLSRQKEVKGVVSCYNQLTPPDFAPRPALGPLRRFCEDGAKSQGGPQPSRSYEGLPSRFSSSGVPGRRKSYRRASRRKSDRIVRQTRGILCVLRKLSPRGRFTIPLQTR